jgi:hypothetical protein
MAWTNEVWSFQMASGWISNLTFSPHCQISQSSGEKMAGHSSSKKLEWLDNSYSE